MISFILFIVIIIVCVWVIKTSLHNINCSADKFKFKYDVYFVGGNINHNNITKLQKGKCLFKVENGLLNFIQGDNVIQDNVNDIESIRTWIYDGSNYFAIKMKTHSEYMFGLIIDNTDEKILNLLKAGMINALRMLAKKLNVEFTDCGESQSSDDDK